MKIKNNKVYLFIIVLSIWTVFYNLFRNITNYSSILNYLFWIVLLIICIISFENEYERKKYKDILFKDIVIFTLLYLIIYYLLGFIVGFKKSPLSFEFFNILTNLIKFVILRGMIECVKYYLIKENNTKFFVIIVSILFILINIDINYLISFSNNSRDLFKYISSSIIPLIMYGIVGSYIIVNTDLKTSLLLQITPIILTYTIPISPNLDWYLYSVFHLVYLLVLYIFLKYDIEKREKTKKSAKSNVVSLISSITAFVILILFVLGVFNYVPIGVMSNSMKPRFERGDIIIYKKVKNIDNIKKDDIICYQLDDIKVMHRVKKIENINDKKYFTTKGDNLLSNDPLKVKEEQIIGVIVLALPRLGYPSVWLYELLN